MKRAIITGVSGQDGAYLASFLISKGYEVVGLTRNNHQTRLKRINYLGIDDQVIIEECDLIDLSSVIDIITRYRPDEIYNLAAQSSVNLSFHQPIGTIQFNITSVLNILEAVRVTKIITKIYQASSSEMYGKVNGLPVTINTPMHPLSPYAISKASSFWTVVNYREAYNLFACNGVLFNHESFLGEENFFIKKVIKEAVKNRKNPQWILKVGNIDVKRDFGYSPKYVEAMWLMLQRTVPKDYIICSGRSYLLKEIIGYVFNKLDISIEKVVVSPELYRPVDITDIYGDNSKAVEDLGWDYNLDFFAVLDLLIDEELRCH